MLFLHFLSDFTLQGWFAQGKQKSWWKKQCKDADIEFSPYRHDYVCALIEHSAYWAVITFAPLIFFASWPSWWSMAIFVIVQIAVHAVIDDRKANKLKINLVQDQLAHMGQLILAVLVFAMLEV